ncbi:MAG: H-NS histone family protein [Magnetococcales bacterium]|nr:H-NS histone family protein [Magnetococcales bacterium]
MASSRKSKGEQSPVIIQSEQPSTMVDTSNMTYDQLVALQAKIRQDIEAQKMKMLIALRAEFHEKASAHGFTLEEVLGTSSDGSTGTRTRSKRSDAGIKQEPYYQNPADPTQTAFRKGKKPAWLQALIDQGVDIETLKIVIPF